MPSVQIADRGCRGCSQCVDICPVDVFQSERLSETGPQIARVKREQDCVGCFSCYALCPSQCITLSGITVNPAFFRLQENVQLVERFLRSEHVKSEITPEQWDKAFVDVGMTLVSLAKAMDEILGSGIHTVGRRSGQLAASHLPESYEENTLEGVLESLRSRFAHAFDFEYQIDESAIQLRFLSCSLFGIVEKSGDQVGKGVLCRLFHSYIASLITSFQDRVYQPQLDSAARDCCTIMLEMSGQRNKTK